MSGQEELYVCLLAKEFPAQAVLRLRPDLQPLPVAVLTGEPPRQTVCSLNAKARFLGVMHGMTRTELETVPSLIIMPRSSAEEASAQAALLECADIFSPRVEERSDANNFLCVLDIAGTERLFRAPQSLARALLQRVETLGLKASVAISRNFHAAIACTRGAAGHVALCAPGSESAALAPLPLNVLDLSQQHAELLSLWGICTLGALAALPEKELIARLGQEGRRLRLLARGALPHHFVPREVAFSLEERMELDRPVDQFDSLLFALSVMLEQLIVRAAARVLALASITVSLSLEGGSSHTRRVRPALPTNDRPLWIKLLHLDLEAHPPQAATLSIALRAEHSTTSKLQLGLFSPQLPEPMRLDVTLARIRAVVGEKCVGSPVLQDTHEPDAFRIEPFRVLSSVTSAVETSCPRVTMRRLRPPEKLSITLHGRRPNSFSFRGERYAVEHAYGPWLTEGDWWSHESWALEQWDLIARSTEGAMLCCCLVHDRRQQQWQMVGLYD